MVSATKTLGLGLVEGLCGVEFYLFGCWFCLVLFGFGFFFSFPVVVFLN